MMKYLRKVNWKEVIGWIWFGIMFFMFLTYIRHNISILTELSNGKIEVWDYGTTSGGLQIESMNQWLQLKSHINQLPTGKVFVLLSSEQLQNTQWSVEPDSSDILYQSGLYTLLGFDNYEDVKSHLQGRKKSS